MYIITYLYLVLVSYDKSTNKVSNKVGHIWKRLEARFNSSSLLYFKHLKNKTLLCIANILLNTN